MTRSGREHGAAVPRDLGTAARIIREATKDKSYQETPLGQEVAAYLRQKRKRLTMSSYRNYEGILHKLVIDHADLELDDFAPPAGTDLVEAFMDRRWADGSPRAYNRNLSIVRDFFKWAQQRRGLAGDPTLVIERAKARDVHRKVFTLDQVYAVYAANPDPYDELPLRLLFDYGLRKGALRAVRIQHFDFSRRRLTIFTKGKKVRQIAIPDRGFWSSLEQIVQPMGPLGGTDYLLHPRRRFRDGTLHAVPDRPLSNTATERRWKDVWMTRAGLEGNIHMARHTAGQRILDATHNIVAVQKQLGHASIQTTADVYTDWDIDSQTSSLEETFAKESGQWPRIPSVDGG